MGGAGAQRRSSFATDSSAGQPVFGGATGDDSGEDEDEDEYKPGMPIGLLAARGEFVRAGAFSRVLL